MDATVSLSRRSSQLLISWGGDSVEPGSGSMGPEER
jgi:hypothetical protein